MSRQARKDRQEDQLEFSLRDFACFGALRAIIWGACFAQTAGDAEKPGVDYAAGLLWCGCPRLWEWLECRLQFSDGRDFEGQDGLDDGGAESLLEWVSHLGRLFRAKTQEKRGARRLWGGVWGVAG